MWLDLSIKWPNSAETYEYEISGMIRLIVCDDHDMVRTALVRMLESHHRIQVVAEAANGGQLLNLLARIPALDFDVILLDLSMGAARVSTSIDFITQLLLLQSTLRILVVSMHNEPEIVNAALQFGALGYVSKASSIEVLHEGIAHVHQSRRFLDPNLVESIVVKHRVANAFPWDVTLTKREREVMVLLCAGRRVSDIAQLLCLSIKTVSTHKIRLMEKLDVKNNADLIKLGVSQSLV
jgi:DNA-binding NarL/FixJ family response regulator